jgi:Fe2+ or Zn2+ uptake regulation protein
MQIKLDVQEDSVQKIAERAKVLGNPKNLLILLALQEKSLSLDEIHNKLKKKSYLHRESTYRALEKLVQVKFLEKEYDKANKKIIYIL